VPDADGLRGLCNGRGVQCRQKLLVFAPCRPGAQGARSAYIEPAHGASLRVAEKAGFREFEELLFHARPVRLYRLHRQAWSR